MRTTGSGWAALLVCLIAVRAAAACGPNEDRESCPARGERSWNPDDTTVTPPLARFHALDTFGPDLAVAPLPGRVPRGGVFAIGTVAVMGIGFVDLVPVRVMLLDFRFFRTPESGAA